MVTEPALARVLTGTYDFRLVFLSVLIAIFACYAALDLTGRVASAHGYARRVWLSGGATAMGFGIWSMHYVGMLAFKLPVPVLYDWRVVLLSLFAAIFASAVALFVASRAAMGVTYAIAGSLVMGGGIASMHYIGMAAMRLQAMCVFSVPIVAASIALAVAIAFVALMLTFRFRNDQRWGSTGKFVSAVVMGAAVPAMHYTGMAAASFMPSDSYDGSIAHAVGITSLGATSIIVVTFMVLAITIVTSQADRVFSAQARELESREWRLQQILEITPDAFIATNFERRVTDWNAGAETLFGWTRDEMLGRKFFEVCIPPECRQFYESKIRELRELATGRLRNRRFETSVQTNEGRRVPVEITVSMVHIAGVQHYAAFVRDLSERERAEEKFRGVLNSSSEAMLFVNSEGKISVLNGQAERLFGYERAELLDQPLAILIPESLRHGHSEHMNRYFMNPTTRSMGAGLELMARKKDGTHFPVEISLTPIDTAEGRLISTVVIDISARKEKELALRSAHERLSHVLAEAEHRADDAAKLAELLDILQACQTVDEACMTAKSILPEILSARSGALCLTSSSRDLVEEVLTWGEESASETTFRPAECWALRRGKAQSVNPSGSALRCAHVHEIPGGGYICVPLAAQGETLGVLYLEADPSEPGAKPGAAIGSLMSQAVAAGERISLALANLHLREVLRNQSVRDPLTGLFNRRYMEETLTRELKRAGRAKEPVSFLMLDVDHFKRFNDTFGHLAGDTLLRSLGKFLVENTRGHDVVCRYGGEEFAVIMVGASLENAMKRAEALRQGVKKLTIEHSGEILGVVTISVGVSAFPQRSEPELLLQSADQALYRAKAEGRDRVASDGVQSTPSDAQSSPTLAGAK